MRGTVLLHVDMTDVGDSTQITSLGGGIGSRLYCAWVPRTNMRGKGLVHHSGIAVGQGEYGGLGLSRTSRGMRQIWGHGMIGQNF